ncbi:MAG: tetrahydromethanopterin synthesis protein [Gammaproteobacteria bacterium]|nr:tetrahydromethanopterin synthesis protein [Gammaproteobacteria bacterium]|tara:strand:+ start:1197 stop:1757 length:561 start_codon:yes stop_codon:yes gene_type:complete
MIHESIVISKSNGKIHIAPMGIEMNSELVIIKPFKPSTTLENLKNNGIATVNFTDDVRIFAGIVSGFKKNWDIIDNNKFDIPRLKIANTHLDVKVQKVFDNDLRPKIECQILNKAMHFPFHGFNRAQFSVIEASVLISRMGIISMEKIEDEIKYLKIGIDKTAGSKEKEAWDWIEKSINNYRKKND